MNEISKKWCVGNQPPRPKSSALQSKAKDRLLLLEGDRDKTHRHMCMLTKSINKIATSKWNGEKSHTQSSTTSSNDIARMNQKIAMCNMKQNNKWTRESERTNKKIINEIIIIIWWRRRRRRERVSSKAECNASTYYVYAREYGCVCKSECWEHLKLKKTETNNKICTQMFYKNMCTFAYSLTRPFHSRILSILLFHTVQFVILLLSFFSVFIFIPSNNNIREQHSKMIIIKIITTLHLKKMMKIFIIIDIIMSIMILFFLLCSSLLVNFI